MVSWWPGDGSPIDIQDGNDGTLVGGTTFTSGKVGQAFSFDGTDDHVEISPSPSTLDITTGHTVDLWVNADSFPGSDKLGVFINQFSSGSLDKFVGLLPDGKISYFLFPGFSTPLESNTSITTGTFHHVTATFDGSTAKIYIDGVLDASKSVGSSVSNSDTKLFIGFHPLRTSEGIVPFDGQLDEIEWYNRALSQSEIQNIFNAGRGYTQSSLE